MLPTCVRHKLVALALCPPTQHLIQPSTFATCCSAGYNHDHQKILKLVSSITAFKRCRCQKNIPTHLGTPGSNSEFECRSSLHSDELKTCHCSAKQFARYVCGLWAAARDAGAQRWLQVCAACFLTGTDGDVFLSFAGDAGVMGETKLENHHSNFQRNTR